MGFHHLCNSLLNCIFICVFINHLQQYKFVEGRLDYVLVVSSSNISKFLKALWSQKDLHQLINPSFPNKDIQFHTCMPFHLPAMPLQFGKFMSGLYNLENSCQFQKVWASSQPIPVRDLLQSMIKVQLQKDVNIVLTAVVLQIEAWGLSLAIDWKSWHLSFKIKRESWQNADRIQDHLHRHSVPSLIYAYAFACKVMVSDMQWTNRKKVRPTSAWYKGSRCFFKNIVTACETLGLYGTFSWETYNKGTVSVGAQNKMAISSSRKSWMLKVECEFP